MSDATQEKTSDLEKNSTKITAPKEETSITDTNKVNLAKPNDTLIVSTPTESITIKPTSVSSDTVKTSASIAEQRISAMTQQDHNIVLNLQEPNATVTNQFETTTTSQSQRPHSVGTVLKHKREELNISIEEIATRIRLSIKQVTALEQDDLTGLPQITFVRGFVRNYARAVNLDGDDLLRKYPYPVSEEAQTPVLAKSGTNIRIQTHGSRSRIFGVKKSAMGIIIFIIASLATYEIFRDKGGHVSPQNVLSNIQKSLQIDPNKMKNNQQMQQGIEQSSVGQGQTPMITTIQQAPIAEAPQPVPVQKPVFSKDKSEILLEFKGNSWVQIRDRDDKVVFSQVGNEGLSEKIVGKAPFMVLVGNTPNIKITYNNNPVDLSSYSGAKVAKLKLN